MGRRRNSVVEDDDDVNLTPMLDVVFILLIFFIVTAQFIKEPGVDITRTEVNNLQTQNPLGVLIAINENSEIYMNKQVVPISEVAYRIREFRKDNKKGRLVVQPDANSEAGVLIELMDIINEVEGNNVVQLSVVED